MSEKFSLSSFEDIDMAKKLLEEIQRKVTKPLNIMEVCGTHTRNIYKYGIDKLLPEKLNLISGPGCPVCVTPKTYIDNAIILSKKNEVIITTFGDLLRIPGSGDSSLSLQRGQGANIGVVYSPLDCLKLAENNRDKEIIFLAVGFETTAPAIALMIKEAKKRKINNLYVLLALKTMPRAMEGLILDKDINLDGFMCPGHVATIIGTREFSRLSDKYKISMTICGFQPLDILGGLLSLIEAIYEKKYYCENRYARAVKVFGNISAMKAIDEVFIPSESIWRGLGNIEGSGYGLKDIYSSFDATRRYSLKNVEDREIEGCLCGEILKGRKKPKDCKLYGGRCTPKSPVGPCMVSNEGTCGIAYNFGE